MPPDPPFPGDPGDPGPPADEPAPPPPDWSTPFPSEPGGQRLRPERLGLDRLGLIQALGGLILGLIALFSSYDHITVRGHTIHLQQQWGIPLIAASVATVFVDAQLATRSRLRAAQDSARAVYAAAEERYRADQERQRADRERHRADQERHRADQERDRAAEGRERQAQDAERQNEGLDLLRRSALLSARLQLDPTDTNRARLRTFLDLISGAG